MSQLNIVGTRWFDIFVRFCAAGAAVMLLKAAYLTFQYIGVTFVFDVTGFLHSAALTLLAYAYLYTAFSLLRRVFKGFIN